MKAAFIPTRTRSGITIGGAVIAQQAEAEAIDQSWRNRLMSDAAKARAVRREHAIAMKTLCEKNLKAFRESEAPEVPHGRALRVCLVVCLTAAAITLMLDVRVWRPDAPQPVSTAPHGDTTQSTGSLREIVGQDGNLGRLLEREPQRQRIQPVGSLGPDPQE